MMHPPVDMEAHSNKAEADGNDKGLSPDLKEYRMEHQVDTHAKDATFAAPKFLFSRTVGLVLVAPILSYAEKSKLPLHRAWWSLINCSL